MKKRWISALLALVLTVALLPASAYAATVQDKAGANLNAVEQKLYQAMADNAAALVAGKQTSTSVTVPLKSDDLRWTARELGLSSITDGNVLDPLDKKFNETLNFDKIYTCLELNFPLEMFWANNYWRWNYHYQFDNSKVWITDIIYSIDVTPAYRGGSLSTVDPKKMAQASAVVPAAEAIVQANAGKSDYEKLTAYRDAICARTSYNWSAYKAMMADKDPFGEDHTYGDPWQLVYVFDDNPNTNVICEGYSKAFKFLCDLSEFNGDVTCYLAEGTMGDERHMWNVVRMGDGNFYLVDVTNSDTDMAGEHGGLFLAGGSGSGEKYTLSGNGWRYIYTYREDQKDLFTSGYLPLSASDYSPDKDPSGLSKPSSSSSFTDVPASEYYAAPVAWAVEKEITKGATETTFEPDTTCTQVQILTFLYRAAGEPEPKAELPVDIAGKNVEYAARALRWAAEKGMIDETFDVSAQCTRASAVSYIWQAFDKPEAQVSSFTDVDAEANYADAVSWAVAKEVTNGDGSEEIFSPDKVCTRGQIVTFLYRAYH